MNINAQTKTEPKPQPKREFRGVWVATVSNIDWPSSSHSSSSTQIKELTDILDSHQKTGINAIMFQVRPAADALYAKSHEPWSQWLTGVQGRAPNPLYDPLEIAINEAHKRGMELHAWLNPYRATFSAGSSVAANSIINQKPEWFFTYGGQKIFNPGLPEVRAYILKIVLDVVDNYDVDGIHMDDYFYPYPIHGQKINDSAAYKEYGKAFDSVDDWRRNNVDLMIKMLSDSIHKHKPYLKFGISPIGIWKNRSQDPRGSETNGISTYTELYADTRKWIMSGWVDYINPQVYWSLGYRLAAFEKVIDWWSDNTYNRHLYIGQAPYRIIENVSPAFRLSTQLPDQLKYIRKNARVQGSIYFSSKSVTKNPLGFADSLRQNYYRYPAMPPTMLWLDSVAPNAPRNLLVKLKPKAAVLSWEAPLPAKDKEPVYGYVIYRFYQGEKANIEDPQYILQIKYNTETAFVDATIEPGKTYQYVVTAIDRLKNESYPSAVVNTGEK
ncbi:glycoside hydrolase family 10 protein [Mucilaginibacter gracilis]|uniref:glycoside hydrolase family 10 protein n=1 Tax=Mucilaginibacter gracilis TaxID=423350 RepID=UPI002938DD8D|nr:family 10 glycosylhydrolase [Mucilaginibacter gracilis]